MSSASLRPIPAINKLIPVMSAERLHSAATIKADSDERYQEKCRRLEEEVQRLRFQVEEMTSKKDLEEPEGRQTAVLPVNATKTAAVSKSTDALRLENDSLLVENEELRNRVSELEGEISEFDEETTALQQENEKLQAKIHKCHLTSQKLEELQKLIKELNENWVTALGREKALANQLFIMKEEYTLCKERGGMLVEDLAAWQGKAASMSMVQAEFYTLQEEVQEIPKLKSEYKKLTAENMKIQRFYKQKTLETEKLQEDLFVLCRKVEYMRVTLTQSAQSKGAVIEESATEKASNDLLKQKYEKVKGKYKNIRDQLAMCSSRIRCFETSLEQVTQQQTTLMQKLKTLSENDGSVSTISDDLEDTSVAIGTLKERLHSKTFFTIEIAEEMQILSMEEEENRSKVEYDKIMLEARVSELESEVHSLKSSLAAAQGRLDILEKVEKLVQRHFPRAKDILLILNQVLVNREEELRVKVQYASKPMSPSTTAGHSEQPVRRSTISLNSSGHNFQAVGGVKAVALANSLKELEAKPEPKKKPTFGGLFKLG